MIVEDEPDIGTILSQLLSSRYDVVWASNGLEALERLSWYEPDLTIMDLMMPVINGIDTTRAIKKDNDYAAMPVLFLTARKDNQAVRDALMAGGDLYLEKPFDPPELLSHLQEMITKNNLQPSPKAHTLDEIRHHFEGAGEAANETEAAEPPGRLSLTELLAKAAAQPRSRVVAVFDSPEILDVLRKALRTEYEFIGVRDAEAALDQISAYQPDVLLLNFGGTTISGVLLAHLLRVNRHFRAPSVALLLDESAPDELAKASHLGAHCITWDTHDAGPVQDLLKSITSASGFQRVRKRLDYREILRREEPEDDEF